jgi:hypothetical protein
LKVLALPSEAPDSKDHNSLGRSLGKTGCIELQGVSATPPKRRQTSETDTDASVYDGHTLLGFLVDEPTQCAARDARRFLIGLFPDRTAATHAVVNHARRASQTA